MILRALVALQTANTGYDMRQVLAIDVPLPLEATGPKSIDFFQEATRRVRQLPGVEHVAVGNFVPWRDEGVLLRALPFAAEGYAPAPGEEEPRARLRNVTPGFFAALGVPLLAGRDFTDDDRARPGAGGDREPERRAARVPERRSARSATCGGPIRTSASRSRAASSAWWPTWTTRTSCRARRSRVYHPLRQMPCGGRLFVHTTGDPYALVAPVTRIIREISADQPVERAATLADVRAEVLAPERLNAFVLSGFAGVALLIAVVGVAGVLAFTVSARTREFGVRLALGSTRRHLLAQVLSEGALIAAIGIGRRAPRVATRSAGVAASHAREHAAAGRAALAGRRRRTHGRRRPGIADAGRARLARGRGAGPSIGVDHDPRTDSSEAASTVARRRRGGTAVAGPDRLHAVRSRRDAVRDHGRPRRRAPGRRVVAVLQPGTLARAGGCSRPDAGRGVRDDAVSFTPPLRTPGWGSCSPSSRSPS